jgi:hypothetical protein
MLLKKILFGIVWTLFLPFLSLYLLVRNLKSPFSMFWKIGWIRQSVYEKMVLQKKEVIDDFFKHAKYPDATQYKWDKERREIQKFAKKHRKP